MMGKRLIKLCLIFLFPVFFSVGCSDFVEVQERNFVLAMGISHNDGGYEAVFANPEFGSDTKEAGTKKDKGMEAYQSNYMGMIEDLYNSSSDKRLDFRHLEVVVLDKNISTDKDVLEGFIQYLKENYEISRSVLVFYYSGDIKEVFELDGSLDSSIGEYIKKLDSNTRGRFQIKPVTVGNLIMAFSEGETIVIPALKVSEEKLKLSSGAVFYEGELKKEMSEEEYLLYLIAKGEGSEYTIYVLNAIPVLLKKLDSSFLYEYKEGIPKISIKLKADAERIGLEKEIGDEVLALAVSDYLENVLSDWIEIYMKENRLDILRLYDWSGVKNKQIWNAYSGRRSDFMEDLEVMVTVKSRIE